MRLMSYAMGLLGVVLLALAAGLGGGSPAVAQDTELEQGVSATMHAAVAAYNGGDLPTLKRLFTDQGFEAVFGLTKSEAASSPEFFENPVTLRGVSKVEATADGAVATVEFENGLGIEAQLTSFVRQGPIWVVDDMGPGSATLAPGTAVVDLTLQEFAFVFDAAAVTTGNFGLNVTNSGAQPHEVLVQLAEPTSDAELLEAFLSEDESGPPPFLDFGFLGFLEPGESATAALSRPLADGHYALVCFVPDPEDDTPHALKGMLSQFTVGTGGASAPISPPSTGDGGLLDAAKGAWSATLALVGTAMIAGAVGLRLLQYRD